MASLPAGVMRSILIVEDDISIADVLTSMLRFLGCKVSHVPHPKAALEFMDAEIPNLFMVDFYMPYLNGLEFCQILKEDPRTKDIPVVMLSAEKSPESERAAQKAGAREYLLKPLSLDDLEAMLSRIFA